jgi:uncharacterized membrane protein YfhO
MNVRTFVLSLLVPFAQLFWFSWMIALLHGVYSVTVACVCAVSMLIYSVTAACVCAVSMHSESVPYSSRPPM